MSPRLSSPARPSPLSSTIVALLVLLAVALRGYDLGVPLFWVDEAESALNALSILADGVPSDTYLGEPLFENTLVRPWPEHPEFEFRDVSYSDRGLAVYHSWIPLYAIAAAFRLAGVTPADARRGPPLRGRDVSAREIAWWTAVPRLPSLVFSALFVIALWRLGRAVHSEGVGFALAFAGASSSFLVFAGRQARYYSAALAAETASGLAIWLAWRRGRVRDHMLAGAFIGVLFHTHSVSAMAMTAVYLACLPIGRHQPRLAWRLFAAGGTAAALILPWVVWSGLLHHVGHLPPARQYMGLASVLRSVLTTRSPILATTVFGILWLVWARLGLTSLRWRQPILDTQAALYFASMWLLLTYAVFVAFIPAASFAMFRLQLVVAVPGLVVMALVVAAACRAIHMHAGWAPVLALVALLVVSRQLPPRLAGGEDPAFVDLIRDVKAWAVQDDGRIYASPNDHLIFTYYSGRHVQSYAPVRREWFERADDVVVIAGRRYDPPPISAVQDLAGRHGVTLDRASAYALSRAAVQVATAEDLVAEGITPQELAPLQPQPLAAAVVGLVREHTHGAVVATMAGTPLDGEPFATWEDFRHAFFYWFVDPARRVGDGLNYRTCLTRAQAIVHASGYTLMDCRRSPRPPLVSERPTSEAVN